ncbi:MAG: hypothetical protein UR60_C0031G0002 [Candidatus Moranbacteria bacterium GW2011_GWF2_34_56]|nr:MAG: hypothetical protein UR51_C0019G0005 [Candidatus Moranbacteria bacterium GW2011_GWF1_34_10]KKP64015.1 MAG: hypothetical protein UR60_C0031G0002 [Candidatus Moranbacteria bacterium GW2011_GWF2_34_56]HBI16874.1 hypothetical protein [Candidatus Moranbacteria bacterium]
MENETKNESRELIDYIVGKIQTGISHDEIKKQLRSVGWSEEEVDSAYATGLAKYGVPVPARNVQAAFSKKSTTVEIVANFFSFILLGIFATSLGMLLYGVINYFFQDKLNNYYRSGAMSSETIHYSIAALIISFPLYYLAMRFWFKRFREDEGKVESLLTKWITYLVLLVSAITIVGDLIVVIFSMLQGELTIRFFLKALTIFMIAGGVFGFYFMERKKVQYKKDIPRKVFVIFGWAVTGVVVVSIILGFMASGSPKTERMRSFDNTRAQDLQNLANCISSYANEHKAMPESLAVLLEDSAYGHCSQSKDPETDALYEYRVINKSYKSGEVTKGDFELCAEFSLNSQETEMNNRYGYYDNSKWFQHNAGRNCDKESIVIENNNIINNMKAVPQY